jgi:hypothetical protein
VQSSWTPAVCFVDQMADEYVAGLDVLHAMHSGSDELRNEGPRCQGAVDQADRIPTSNATHGVPTAQPAASTSADDSSAATTSGESPPAAGSLGLDEKPSFFLFLYEYHRAGVWGIIALTSRPHWVARAQPGESEHFEKGS